MIAGVIATTTSLCTPSGMGGNALGVQLIGANAATALDDQGSAYK
jgi:hypothetical protein